MSKLTVPALLCGMLLFSASSFSRQSFFKDISENGISRRSGGEKTVQAAKARTLQLDMPAIRQFLAALPAEKNIRAKRNAPLLYLPMPDGSIKDFNVWESSIMEPALAGRYGSIKTYAGEAADNSGARIRFDLTPLGFHAMITPAGDESPVYIDPYQGGDILHYTSYRRSDVIPSRNRSCLTEAGSLNMDQDIAARGQAGVCAGTQLRTFRLALAGTGEYAVRVCTLAGVPLTKANVLAAMTTTLNRVNMVYERDLAIRMVLVGNNDQLIYLDGTTDPYTNETTVATLNTNNTNCNTVIGSANYDIGHVFNTDDGGIAGLGVVCTTSKGRGATGLPDPVGEVFNIDYVAHEMGHQFGGNHTFNAETSNCGGGNRNGATAVEPGSGITIMGYAGICGSTNNLAASSLPYFHGRSIDEIGTYVSTISCQSAAATGNTIPVVDAGASYAIPTSTPFILTGSATDADADVLSYSWEQIDAGPAGNWNAPSGNAAIFRSFAPAATPVRYFPRLSDVISNTTTIGEILPAYARTMNFRLTARDGLGTCASEMQVTVINTGSAFQVTAPNSTGISWQAGSKQTVTWNVAGTDAAPVSCSQVIIELSVDGGLTYPTILAASVPNDGSECVVIPNTLTSQARIRVRAEGNIFYDISNNNFSIVAAQPTFELDCMPVTTLTCPAPATVSAGTLSISSVLGFTGVVSLSAESAPAGTTITFSPQNAAPGSSTQVTIAGANSLPAGTYSVTIKGVSGSVEKTRILNFTIQPGAGPVVTTPPQARQVCAGGTTSFTVAHSGTAAGYQWQVSTNNGNTYINLNNQTAATLNLSDIGLGQNNYLYRVVIYGQCNTTVSSSALLTVYTLPQTSLTASPSTSVMPGSSAILTTTITPGSSSVVTPSWFYNGNEITVTGNSLPVTVEGLGTYQVKVEDANGCKAESQAISITAQASERLFIYPNPASNGEFTVTYFNTSGNTSQTVTVYDSKGARVYSRSFAVSSSYQLHRINLRGAATGIYYVMLSDASGKKIKEEKVLIR